MEEYYFLFALAFIWIVFAVVQDLRTREVANWLNFSLIAFVLAYRAFYGIFSKDLMFFVYGFIGVLLFVVFGYIFYYSRIFAGGDAKLLMGLGGVLPYQNFSDYFYLGLGFVFVLFIVGSIYSLIYSLFLVEKNKRKFVAEFKREFVKNKKLFYFTLILVIIFEIIILISGQGEYFYFSLFGLLIFLLPVLYIYTKALEQGCMIKLVSPGKLTEGDWLEKDVKVGKKVIKKSVHGLSWQEIKLLRKAKNKVWIKEGIPFTPSFLVAFIIMVVIFKVF